jgi:hypothetical protein
VHHQTIHKSPKTTVQFHALAPVGPHTHKIAQEDDGSNLDARTKKTTYEKPGSACDSRVVLLRGVQAVLTILSRRLCFSSVFHLHS